MNALGKFFRVTSFGESHGSHIGCVIEGCPAGLSIDHDALQQAVDQRKTGQNDFSSTRSESDRVELVSGVFEQRTIGSPICVLIKNEDQQVNDYTHLKNVFRPGHADAAYHQKYGHRDHRGGGRSSIRITAAMVAAGDIARQYVQMMTKIDVLAFVSQIGPISMPEPIPCPTRSTIVRSAVKCPDEKTSADMQALINEVKLQGDTLGGSIRCVVKNVPAGLGEPVFGKMQAALAHAMLSINTVKGFAYGDGIKSAAMKGSVHNDPFIHKNGQAGTLSNHHGGILGGISSGEDIRFQLWFKPISSIQQEQQTLNTELQTVSLNIGGRHDVCAVPRAVAIVEAYTWIILADLYLQNQISTIEK